MPQTRVVPRRNRSKKVRQISQVTVNLEVLDESPPDCVSVLGDYYGAQLSKKPDFEIAKFEKEKNEKSGQSCRKSKSACDAMLDVVSAKELGSDPECNKQKYFKSVDIESGYDFKVVNEPKVNTKTNGTDVFETDDFLSFVSSLNSNTSLPQSYDKPSLHFKEDSFNDLLRDIEKSEKPIKATAHVSSSNKSNLKSESEKSPSVSGKAFSFFDSSPTSNFSLDEMLRSNQNKICPKIEESEDYSLSDLLKGTLIEQQSSKDRSSLSGSISPTESFNELDLSVCLKSNIPQNDPAPNDREESIPCKSPQKTTIQSETRLPFTANCLNASPMHLKTKTNSKQSLFAKALSCKSRKDPVKAQKVVEIKAMLCNKVRGYATVPSDKCKIYVKSLDFCVLNMSTARGTFDETGFKNISNT